MTEPVANGAAGLGQTIAQAEATGFFQWFSLDASEGDTDADWRGFRPSGPRFHDLVVLTLRLSADQCISAARLDIDRSFIAEASIRPFARDIAQSFLGWILPPDAQSAMQSEINAVGQFADGESQVIAHRAAVVGRWNLTWGKRPKGDASSVFNGETASATWQIGAIHVAFENRRSGQLRISVDGSTT